MVLKRLKLPKFLMVWHERFLHTSMWVSEEGQEFQIFSKNTVFLISSGKNQISSLLALEQKRLEKSTSAPPGSVQFISASRPSTEYFIKNTGTGSDGRSCHLSH